MLIQNYCIIGSSSRICWQVTMCARVDKGKKNKIRAKTNIILLYLYSLMTQIICHVYLWNIPEQKYFADIKLFTVTADLSDSVTELSNSMLESFTSQMGITIEEENILVYISGYICRKVSWSACDQCKVILMPIINCIHICLRGNIWIYSRHGDFVPRQN